MGILLREMKLFDTKGYIIFWYLLFTRECKTPNLYNDLIKVNLSDFEFYFIFLLEILVLVVSNGQVRKAWAWKDLIAEWIGSLEKLYALM